MPRTTFIYALVDPITKAVRYVGKSNNPARRLTIHVNGDGCNQWKDNWLTKLKAVGRRPDLRILEECDQAEWPEAERWWIVHMRSLGEPLTNLADGGDAPPDGKGVPKSKEHRKAVSNALKDAGVRPPSRQGIPNPHTPEWNAKIAAAHEGRKLSPEHTAAMRAMWAAKTPEERAAGVHKAWVTRRANAAKHDEE